MPENTTPLFGMLRRLRRVVAPLTAAALVLGQLPASALAQSPAPISRAEYEACQSRDVATFRGAVETLVLKSLKAGAAKADYGKIVADEWRKGGVDEILDKQVDVSVEEIRRETSWATLIATLGSKDKAQEIATAIAERVYRSEALKKALEDLSGGVGRDMAKRIELATSDAAEPAVQCIQAFLGPRYGSVVARSVGAAADKEFNFDPERRAATVTPGQILLDSKEGIAGTVVLIVRRQLSRMAARVGQRIVGAILSRVVAVVASGVGIVLIAKDVWELRNGVLPIIAQEMKSAETKGKVREELAATLAEQIGDSLRETANQTADRVIEIWQEFRAAHARVLDLAERNPGFKEFLEAQRSDRLARVDEVTGLVLASEGEPGVLRRLADGTLHEAVNRLPPEALEIARDTRSIATAFAWNALAGDNLKVVVQLEIHRRAKPEDMTKTGLTRILALDDRAAIGRLVALPATARASLVELPADDLKTLARGVSADGLAALAFYLASLDRPAATLLLRAVGQSPNRMHYFESQRVQTAVVASRDQAEAVKLMLRAERLPNPAETWSDMQLLYDGKVSPILVWERHPIAISAVAGGALLLLLLGWRALFGRRPRPRAIATPAADPSRAPRMDS